jgi:putative FmdB family regulatory protein
MPLYEYYCPPCGSQFEVLRPVSQMDNPAVCPSGHTTNNRVLSIFAPIAKSSHGDVATATLPQMAGGDACCGGSCSCC